MTIGQSRHARIWAVIAIVSFCLATFIVLAWAIKANAQAQDDQGYLPPPRYRNVPSPRPEDTPAGPNEYYAEDWIVYDNQHRVMCKDPYVRLDLKTVECVSTEKWR